MHPRATHRVLLATVLAVAPTAAFAAFSPAPPPTRVQVVTDTLHGVPIADPYRWLEDKDAPETRAWVKAQMTYTMDQLGKVAGRDQVVAALAKYTRVDSRILADVQRGKRDKVGSILVSLGNMQEEIFDRANAARRQQRGAPGTHAFDVLDIGIKSKHKKEEGTTRSARGKCAFCAS